MKSKRKSKGCADGGPLSNLYLPPADSTYRPVVTPDYRRMPTATVTPVYNPTKQQMANLQMLGHTPGMIDPSIPNGQTAMNVYWNKREGSSGHSKSKDRYREKGTGGKIGAGLQAAAPALATIPGYGWIAGAAAYGVGAVLKVTDKQIEDQKAVAGSPGNYADGGDMNLNNQSFLVNGDPNVVDSEKYQTSKGPIALDHKEVVKDDFVFSNRIKNLMTGNTFAEDVAPIERSTGKAEKRLRNVRTDAFAKNSIKYNELRSKSIATAQEMLATLAGKRDPQQAQQFQNGGPIYPQQGRPFMSTSNGYYYDPYSEIFYERNAKDGSYTALPPAGVGLVRPSEAAISEHLQMYPRTPENALSGANMNTVLPEVTISASRLQPRTTRTPGKGGKPNPYLVNNPVLDPTSNAPDSLGLLQLGQQAGMFDTSYNHVLFNEQNNYNPGPGLDTTDPTNGATPLQLGTNLTPSTFQSVDFTTTSPSTAPSIQGTTQSNYGPTFGDVLQAIEVGSKFAQAYSGTEKDPYYFDRTPITRQAFDPRPALYQSQRNFQVQSNNLDTASPTLRRALQNQLYAQKLESDNQILTQYQNLNNGATTQYQERLSNQTRYNNQSATYTNDINARNRGQYQNAVQNAFTSLGNFGESLNQRKQSYEALRILKQVYPDVYDRIMQTNS